MIRKFKYYKQKHNTNINKERVTGIFLCALSVYLSVYLSRETFIPIGIPHTRIFQSYYIYHISFMEEKRKVNLIQEKHW